MVKFTPKGHEFEVHYDNGVYMGDISRAHDLNYNFWPELKHGGFWPTHVLQSIIDKLNELNAPIDAEFNAWCEQEAKRGTDGNS